MLKTCSKCETVKAKLDLFERVFDCNHCGVSLDGDVNASVRLARVGCTLLHESAVEETPAFAKAVCAIYMACKLG